MWPRPFRIWNGTYQELEYDVLLPDGKIHKNCYPNAGCMITMDGSNIKLKPDGFIKIRRSEFPTFNEIPKQYQ